MSSALAGPLWRSFLAHVVIAVIVAAATAATQFVLQVAAPRAWVFVAAHGVNGVFSSMAATLIVTAVIDPGTVPFAAAAATGAMDGVPVALTAVALESNFILRR